MSKMYLPKDIVDYIQKFISEDYYGIIICKWDQVDICFLSVQHPFVSFFKILGDDFSGRAVGIHPMKDHVIGCLEDESKFSKFSHSDIKSYFKLQRHIPQNINYIQIKQRHFNELSSLKKFITLYKSNKSSKYDISWMVDRFLIYLI